MLPKHPLSMACYSVAWYGVRAPSSCAVPFLRVTALREGGLALGAVARGGVLGISASMMAVWPWDSLIPGWKRRKNKQYPQWVMFALWLLTSLIPLEEEENRAISPVVFSG